MDYWEECISEAFEDAGITATQEQIDTVASWAESGHEFYSQAHGCDCIPDPIKEENKRLKAELHKEQDKVVCPTCKGKGRLVLFGPIHSADTECHKCRGEGKIS